MASDRELKLEHIVRETLWMARRYADNRRTYAATTVNEAIATALDCGIDVQPDGVNGEMYAKDGDLGKWNPSLKLFEKE